MSYSDLLARMKKRDTDAFLEFTDRYGWSLYNFIRRKHPNKIDADKVYHETMQQLWSCLQNDQFDDPMESILCTMADQITLKRAPRKDLAEIFNPDPQEQPPELHIRRPDPEEETMPGKRKNHFLGNICMVLLFAAFVFSVWLVVDFLMKHGVDAYLDLVQTWFNNAAAVIRKFFS